MKAKKASEVKNFEDIPNVGKRIAEDFFKLGLKTPQDLQGKDGIKLYFKLMEVTNSHHDPCVADVFLAAIDFMNGGKKKDWWEFTKKRKKLLKD